MRDEERKIYNDRIAFGNCSHIFAFRVSGDDAEHLAVNFGNNQITEPLVRLPNYAFIAWVVKGGEPFLLDHVNLIEYPELSGDEVPARKAMAWAKENTGTEKKEIEKIITQNLRN
jgi:hypothetical protein